MRTEREMMDIFLGTTCSGRLMLLGDGNRIDLHLSLIHISEPTRH